MRKLSWCRALMTGAILSLTLPGWAAETASGLGGPGKVVAVHINQQDPHPKAYHPELNDLVQCTWIAPVVPGLMIDNLLVAIEGSGVSLAGTVDTTPPKTVGAKHVSVFLIPRCPAVSKVTFTPISQGKPGKPIEIRVFPNLPQK